MSFFRDLAYTARTLAGAKGRTLLTMLGVVIGVTSVLAIASVGRSAQRLIVGQVETFGTNLVGVIPGASSESGPPPIAFGIVTTTLTLEDVRALGRIPGVVAATPYVHSVEAVSSRGEGVTTTVMGVLDVFPQVENVELAEGRFFGVEDVNAFARVAVLGHGAAEKLFPGGRGLVGERVRIKNAEYHVIGVLEERGSAFFQDQDDQIFVPVTTAQKLVAGIDHVTFARLKVGSADRIEEVKEEVARTLRRRHGIQDASKDDFTVRSTDQALDILGSVTGALNGFLIAVVAISLLVGGVNIMNIMYVSVRERTREIGLRKALGARPGRILAQFLAESAFIALVGGAIGVVAGIGISLAAAGIIGALGYSWTFILPWEAVGYSLAISAGIGLAFGVAPARAASRLDPIVALRFE
jgi:putative ABC transport system permease protein